MFRRAARNGPCPSADMLDECTFIRSTSWVREMIAAETPAWEPAQRAALSAVRTLSVVLPQILVAYRGMVGFPPFDHRRVAVLQHLDDTIPGVIAALEPFRDRRVRPWHMPAELIAMDAIKAWRLAGRLRLGCNAESPLVKFVQAFLDRAGVLQESGTISKLFERGTIGQITKSTTSKGPDL
jgi:hypothetical protein